MSSPVSILRKASKAGQLLFADQGLIVVNKASGVVCQPSHKPGRSGKTLEDLFRAVRARLDMRDDPFQVHRLDKLTTGALALARGPTYARDFAQQFQSRRVQKSYLAIVRGGHKTFAGAADSDAAEGSASNTREGSGTLRGRITVPLRIGNERVVVDKRDGLEALTEWELLGSSTAVPLSLLRLNLLTGIKHQLRVHLASIGCPILGDTGYSTKPPPPEIVDLITPRHLRFPPQEDAKPDPARKGRKARVDPRNNVKVQRMFLHSSHISLFRYGEKGHRYRLGVTAPLPTEFVSLCEAAGLDSFLPQDCIDGAVYVNDKREIVLGDGRVKGGKGEWFAL